MAGWRPMSWPNSMPTWMPFLRQLLSLAAGRPEPPPARNPKFPWGPGPPLCRPAYTVGSELSFTLRSAPSALSPPYLHPRGCLRRPSRGSRLSSTLMAEVGQGSPGDPGEVKGKGQIFIWVGQHPRPGGRWPRGHGPHHAEAGAPVSEALTWCLADRAPRMNSWRAAVHVQGAGLRTAGQVASLQSPRVGTAPSQNLPKKLSRVPFVRLKERADLVGDGPASSRSCFLKRRPCYGLAPPQQPLGLGSRLLTGG